MKRISKSNKKKALYVLNGGISFVVEYASFVLIYRILPITVIAQSLSYLLSLSANFYGSRKFTFASEQPYSKPGKQQVVHFGLLAAFNLVTTNIVIAGLINWLGLAPEIAKLITMAMVVSWNFVIFDKIIFRT